MVTFNHLSTDQVQGIIHALELFSFLEEGEAEEIAGDFLNILGFDTGEFLIQEGGADRSLFVLLHGYASVVKEGAGIPMAQLEPGDFFGEVAFLTGRKRITNVIVHPPSMTSPPRSRFYLDETIRTTILSKQKKTAIVLRLSHEILPTLGPSLRIRFKNMMIDRLSLRVEQMSVKVEALMGESPELEIDPELEALIQQGGDSLTAIEKGCDAIVEHLIEFIERLNQQLSEAF
ncbi:MAG: cyclic nucleotide-binding domain-containing protein [Magnetococcales bacterium]|nr:cyclic nucleotide-binding domain-containing protein [Magnetococcales bacterium]